jgi:hypothetical protein
MGLLDGLTHNTYYQGNDLGNYQFVSLQDIINQFMIIHVGEDKIISKIKRTDVAFHAQRALAELSFDTFKSIKAHQIELPPTLVMPLPHDYVNYTKVSWVDSAGIKHPLYKTNDNSNPFQILQNDDGQYSFPADSELLVNPDFSANLEPSWSRVSNGNGAMSSLFQGDVGIISSELTWRYVTKNGNGANNWSHIPIVYQALDVSTVDLINISADGVAEAITYNQASGGTNTTSSTVRFGVSTNPPGNMVENVVGSTTGYPANPNANTDIFDLQNADGDYSYLEWTGVENSTKELLSINVQNEDTVYVIALAISEFPSSQVYGQAVNGNTLDNVSITNGQASVMLQSPAGNETESSTWNSYKAGTSPESQDDYQDDTYWPMDGSRYGLDPQHAQTNGSFYIDSRLGRIHFSSNISGKTVILDYISDSLGTDGEMQVHKLAEEAMYRFIAHAVISGRANVPEYQVMRFKKEKIAAIRTAKLRLSNLKIEELTQVLRGKSKQIKH